MRRTGPDPVLVDHYESLRRRALSGISTAEPTAGYGLLVQRGMLVWMCTCASCTPPEGPTPVAPSVSKAPTGTLLIPGVEAELVELLAALILNCQANNQPQR